MAELHRWGCMVAADARDGIAKVFRRSKSAQSPEDVEVGAIGRCWLALEMIGVRNEVGVGVVCPFVIGWTGCGKAERKADQSTATSIVAASRHVPLIRTSLT